MAVIAVVHLMDHPSQHAVILPQFTSGSCSPARMRKGSKGRVEEDTETEACVSYREMYRLAPRLIAE
ncbi:unnamed protein product [Urochloa humidicola]